MHQGGPTAVRMPTYVDHSLTDLGLVDAPAENSFDALTRLALRIFGTPVALISVVDEANDRQFFKSQQGLGQPWADRRQTPLSHSFCQQVKLRNEPLVVPCSLRHPLVKDNPAIQELNVISYLGAPFHDPSGMPLGAICVIDECERDWTDDQVLLLQDLACCVSDEIKLRATLKTNDALIAHLEDSHQRIAKYSALRETIVLAFMAPDLTPEERFHSLLHAGSSALGAEFGAIGKAAGPLAQVVFATGPSGPIPSPDSIRTDTSIFASIAAGNTILSQADLETSQLAGRQNLLGRVPGSFIAAPIVQGRQLYGVLEFSNRDPREKDWNEEELSMVSIIAMFCSAHLALHGQIASLKRSETALLGHLLKSRNSHQAAS